mmetsp:Transcript_15522/g.35505  ORF Transcript_15522/g.35505 Transcript_15522/m.35505 type:complete len:1222 (-) Transcript_15522:45-3710(-)
MTSTRQGGAAPAAAGPRGPRAEQGGLRRSATIAEVLQAKRKQHPTADGIAQRRQEAHQSLSAAAYSILEGQLEARSVKRRNSSKPQFAPGASQALPEHAVPGSLEVEIEALILKVGAPRRTLRGPAAASVPILPPKGLDLKSVNGKRLWHKETQRRELPVMIRHNILSLEDKRVNAAVALEKDSDKVKKALALQDDSLVKSVELPLSAEECHVYQPFSNLRGFIPSGCQGFEIGFPFLPPHSYHAPEFSRLSNPEYNQALEVCLGYAALAASGRIGSHLLLTRLAVSRLFTSLQRSSVIGVFACHPALQRFDTLVQAQRKYSVSVPDGAQGLLLEPRVEDANWFTAFELFVLDMLLFEASRDQQGVAAVIDSVRDDFFKRRLPLAAEELALRVEELEDWGRVFAPDAANPSLDLSSRMIGAEGWSSLAQLRTQSKQTANDSRSHSKNSAKSAIRSRTASAEDHFDEEIPSAPSQAPQEEDVEDASSLRFILKRRDTFKTKRNSSKEKEKEEEQQQQQQFELGTSVAPGQNLYIRTVTLAKGELLSSALSQPEAMHLTWMYFSLFRACFHSYYDLPTLGHGEEGEGHMSLCAFVRFCADFGLFPKLVDYASLMNYYMFTASALPLQPPPNRRRRMSRKGFRLGQTLEITQGFSYLSIQDGNMGYARKHELVRVIAMGDGVKEYVVVNEQAIRFRCKPNCVAASQQDFHLIKLTDVRRTHDLAKIAWMHKDFGEMTEEEFTSLHWLSLIDDHLLDRSIRSFDLFSLLCPPGHIRLQAEDILQAIESFDMQHEDCDIEELRVMMELICIFPGGEVDIEDFEAIIQEVRERKAKSRKGGNFMLKDHFEMNSSEAAVDKFLKEFERIFSSSGWKPDVFMRRFAAKQASVRRRSAEAGIRHTCAADLVEAGSQMGMHFDFGYLCGREALVRSLESLTALGKEDELDADDLEQILLQVKKAKRLKQRGRHGEASPFLLSPSQVVASGSFVASASKAPQMPSSPRSPRSRRPSETGNEDLRAAWGEGKTGMIFGVKAFTESLLKVGLGYLTFHGTESQAALPPHLKVAWLLGCLNLSFTGHVEQRQQRGRMRRRSSGLEFFDALHREDIEPKKKLLSRHQELFTDEPSAPPLLGGEDYSRTERCDSCGRLPYCGWGQAACSKCGLGDIAQLACLTNAADAENYPFLHRLVLEWPSKDVDQSRSDVDDLEEGAKHSGGVKFAATVKKGVR